MGSDQQFCLRWHNYQSSLLASLPQLLDSDDLTDVTLSAGGHNLKAHRVVLSACSQYFKELFKVLQPMQHPVIVLPGTNFSDLCALVTFMYSGEVNIYQEQLQGLLTMADAMQIRGLAEVNGSTNNETSAKKDPSCPAAKRPKLSVQTTSTSLLLNQMHSENIKSMSKPLQAETVDTSGSSRNKKNSEFEIYKNRNRPTGICKKATLDNELPYRDFHKNEGVKLKSVPKNLEPYMGSINSARCSKVVTQSESELSQYVEDSHTTPTVGSPVHSEDLRVKCEPDRNVACTSTEEIAPARKVVGGASCALEGMQIGAAVENEVMPDERSPSSDDSGSCNYGIEAIADRIHLSQGPHLSNLKVNSSSGQYTRLLATSNNSKLYATCFVCGKQLSNQYNLRVHMETHQNVNYACSACSHVSRSRDALRKHVSYRHPGEGRERMGNSRDGRLPTGSNSGIMGTTRKPKNITSHDNVQQPQP